MKIEIKTKAIEVTFPTETEEDKLRKIYFEFYDQMDEPERSEAKENLRITEYDVASKIIPKSIKDALYSGFVWSGTKQDSDYWSDIRKKYANK